MPRKNQAEIALRKKMIERHVRIKDLAASTGHDPSVIVKAIKHGRFPRVMAKIKEALK